MGIKDQLLEIAKEHKVKISFRRRFYQDISGWADARGSLIALNIDKSRSKLICAFFHELAHVLNYRNRK